MTSINFKAEELSRGDIKLLDWVGDKLGEKEKFTTASAMEYYGKVEPNSEGFHGVKNRVGHLIGETLGNRGLATMAIGGAGLPAMMALAVAGASSFPILAVGAAAAAIGVGGIALKVLSVTIGEKLAERRMLKSLQDTEPTQSPKKFSV